MKRTARLAGTVARPQVHCHKFGKQIPLDPPLQKGEVVEENLIPPFHKGGQGGFAFVQ
jgi:hypothetical protein